MTGFEGKTVGLALGGGGALGAAHIGVLKALQEFGIQVGCISGTSAGAFVASLYAFGKNWEELAEIAKQIKWMEISKLSLSRYGLLSNEKLGALLKENIGEASIEDALIPLAIVATDIATGDEVVLYEGDAAKAVMASSCIPGIYVPVEMGGRLLVDGGIVENVPVSPLRRLGADEIIGVNLNAGHREYKPKNIVEVLLRSFDFTLKAATRLQTEWADLVITPDLTGFNMYDMNKTDDLIEEGYKAAMQAFEERV
ncbi:MAG: patatin-like phospholipase family protein [Thermovirgaceae bacterium]